MLYNKDTKKLRTDADCIACEHFDRKLLKCNGKDKKCFIYDPKTKTCIDGVTKMPITFNN